MSDIAAGRVVVGVDDEDRENMGNPAFAADKATPEVVSFKDSYSLRNMCVPLSVTACDQLGLLPMSAVNHDRRAAAYTRRDKVCGVAVHAARPTTIRLVAQLTIAPNDFTRPGQFAPLRARVWRRQRAALKSTALRRDARIRARRHERLCRRLRKCDDERRERPVTAAAASHARLTLSPQLLWDAKPSRSTNTDAQAPDIKRVTGGPSMVEVALVRVISAPILVAALVLNHHLRRSR